MANARQSDDRGDCVFCGSRDSRPAYPVDDIFGHRFTLVRCAGCRAFFLSPRPDRKMLAMAYDDSYYGKGEEKFSPAVEKVLDLFRRGRSAWLRRNLKSGASLLDVGCGNGKFLKFLSRYGKYRLFGTELEGNSARRAARIPGITLKIGGLKPDDFAPRSLDAVTLFHVFEHLEEPRKTLEIVSTILKKDGVLVMSFPNIDSFQSRLFKGRWLHLDPPRHLFFFAPKDFVPMMEGYGFRLVRRRFSSLEQNPFGAAQSMLNMVLKKREVLFERLKGNLQYGREYSGFSVFCQKVFAALALPFLVVTDLAASALGKGATVEFTFRKT